MITCTPAQEGWNCVLTPALKPPPCRYTIAGNGSVPSLTVTVTGLLVTPSAEAVMVAEPTPVALTSPAKLPSTVLDTVTTEASLDVQVSVGKTLPPASSRTIANKEASRYSGRYKVRDSCRPPGLAYT